VRLNLQLKENLHGGIFGAILTAGFGFSLLYFNNLPPGRALSNSSYDLLFLGKASVRPDDIVLVHMDDQSHLELKQPFNGSWDRDIYAQLLERLTAEGAKAVVFDIVFSDPNPAHPEGDEKFAKAIKSNGKVILAADFQPDSNGSFRLTRPIDLFLDAASDWGMVQLLQDQDLIVRRHFHAHPDTDRPSLTWATAKLLGAEVTKDPEQHLVERWMNYYGPPSALPEVSLYLAIEPNHYCPSGFFRNKVVFVGAYLTTFFSGQRKDEFHSPYTKGIQFMAGVDVHATQFLNLWRGDWLRRLPPVEESSLISLLGLVLGYGLTRFRPWTAACVALGTTLAVVGLAEYLFLAHRLWFSWMVIAAAQIPAATFYSVIFNSFQLYLQKRLFEQSLARHLPPKRIKQFVGHPELLKPGAEKQMLSIMFTDIENFTSLSEGMDSDELARLMNEYFEAAISRIHQAEGTVVKLIGDAIFAVWNAPDQQAHHHALVCQAAVLLRDQVVRFTVGQSNVSLRTRIGVHTGVANVGNFGSATRFDYTALGENVNLASRMEGLNKHLGTDILITGQTQEGASENITTRFAGHFRLKGFEKAVAVYELLGLRDLAEPTLAWRATFEQSLKEFSQTDFDAAERGFRCTLEMRPGDGPAEFYLRQIAELRLHAPAPGWTGEIELKEK